MELGVKLASAAATLGAFLLVLRLCLSGYPEQTLLPAYQEFTGMLKRKSRASSWYQKKERWLTKNGGAFHYGKNMNPIRFLIAEIVLAALVAGILGMRVREAGLIGGVMAFFLPSVMLIYLNSQDNRRLLPELKLVYHGMELQIRAGVYVTDALAECYGSVREERLRKALLDLAGDIVMRADIYDALNSFQGKFENRYVDSLCIIILQALESGQAAELLGDIGEQLKDMEEIALQQRKASLDRWVTFYQLGIFAAVMGIALYACLTCMLGAGLDF